MVRGAQAALLAEARKQKASQDIPFDPEVAEVCRLRSEQGGRNQFFRFLEEREAPELRRLGLGQVAVDACLYVLAVNRWRALAYRPYLEARPGSVPASQAQIHTLVSKEEASWNRETRASCQAPDFVRDLAAAHGTGAEAFNCARYSVK